MKFFLEIEILSWKFFIKSDFELRIYRRGRYRKQNFLNNQFLGKIYLPEIQFLSSSFIEKSDFDEKFTSEKKVSTQFTQQKNKFFIFRAYFRRHYLDATFFIKNQSFKWLFWKNESYSEENFFLQNEILKKHFFKVSDCELRIFRSGRFYNKKLFK